jgi:hypothetical protein
MWYRILTFFVVVCILASCAVLSEAVGLSPIAQVTNTQESTATDVPETKTPLPSLTATNTQAPSQTPTATPTSTVTPVPTPSGLTEIGHYMWNFSNDLGFTLNPGTWEELAAKGPYMNLPYSISEEEELYVQYFSGGFGVDENADTFLLISLASSPRGMVGVAFSIYKGQIKHADCQGTVLPPKIWGLYTCLDDLYGVDIFDQYMVLDEQGIGWTPNRAYPITMEQEFLLKEKYSLATYPEQTKVITEPLRYY